MPQQVAQPLDVQHAAHENHHPRPHGRHRRLHQQQQRKADAQGDDELPVAGHQCMVHDQLHEKRAGDGEHLQRERHGQHLCQGAAQPGGVAQHARQPHGLLVCLRHEPGGWLHFQRHASEVFGKFRERECFFTHRGVGDNGLAGRQILEHHEVVEIPVQDGWQAQLRQMLHVQSQGARGEAQARRHLHELRQRRALEREGKPAAHGRQVGAVAVVHRDHRQARQTALGGFRLQDGVQLAAKAELQGLQYAHGRRPSRSTPCPARCTGGPGSIRRCGAGPAARRPPPPCRVAAAAAGHTPAHAASPGPR